MWIDDKVQCLDSDEDSFFPQRNQPTAPVPGSIGAPMAIPQHLQERLVIPEMDEEDREAERETKTPTTCRNNGIRCRKGQCEPAGQSTQPNKLGTKSDSTSLGTKSGSTNLGTKSGSLRTGHQFNEGLERCVSNHEQTSDTLARRR